MKNLKQINQDIEALKKEAEDFTPTDKAYKRIQKQVALLNQIKMYLEKEPTVEFCQDELKRLVTLGESIRTANLSGYTPKRPVENKRAAYRSEMDYPLIKSQIQVLKFILH